MKPHRQLALKRENLSDLASDELRSVAGGTHIATDCNCLTHGYSCDVCGIPTLPINVCLAQIIDTIAISGGAACDVTGTCA